jgi:hypothetical protein
MDSELIAVAARHLERLLIVLGGALSIYLGYRMFLAIPRAASETGEGKLELPGGVSIYVTRVGPGVFFALFGAVILGLGLQHGLTLEVKEQRRSAEAGATAPAGVVTERRMSSAVPAASQMVHDSERTGVLGTVEQLSRLGVALDGPGGRALSTRQRTDFDLALGDARRRLLASVWDERAWGPYADFARWVQDGESGAPPTRAAPAVRAYRPSK